MREEVGERDGIVDATRGRVVLLVLSAVQFTNIVDFMIVMPLGRRLKEAMAIGPEQFSLVVASYTLSAAVAGLLAASLVDRFDRKTSFLSLYAGFLVGTLCCGLAPGYKTLLAARVLTGAFGGILGGLAMAIIADVFPEERRGAATGALMSAFALATVVGVPLGLVLSNCYGWNAPFLMLVGLGVFVLAAGARVLPRLRGHMDQSGHRRASPLADVRAVLTHPEHLKAFALVVSLMFGGFAVIPYISMYLEANVGVTKEDLPLVYVTGGVLTLVSSPLIGRLGDRYGRYRVYRVVAPLAAVLMLVMTNLPRVRLALAVAVPAVLMVGNSGRMVLAMTMVTSCVEPRRRGSFMSLNSSVQHLSSGLGAYAAGKIVGEGPTGALTHYDRVGVLGFVMTILSIALAARLRPYTAGPAPADGPGRDHLGVDPAPAAALEMPPAVEIDVPPSVAAPG